MFKLNRGYKELRERLKFEKVDDMKNLPVVVNGNDYFDDTTVNDDHLPCDVIDIVDKYDDVTYLILTENTKGELTIPNVDRNFELIVCNKVCNYYIDTMEKIDDDDYYNYNNICL